MTGARGPSRQHLGNRPSAQAAPVGVFKGPPAARQEGEAGGYSSGASAASSSSPAPGGTPRPVKQAVIHPIPPCLVGTACVSGPVSVIRLPDMSRPPPSASATSASASSSGAPPPVPTARAIVIRPLHRRPPPPNGDAPGGTAPPLFRPPAPRLQLAPSTSPPKPPHPTPHPAVPQRRGAPPLQPPRTRSKWSCIQRTVSTSSSRAGRQTNSPALAAPLALGFINNSLLCLQ